MDRGQRGPDHRPEPLRAPLLRPDLERGRPARHGGHVPLRDADRDLRVAGGGGRALYRERRRTGPREHRRRGELEPGGGASGAPGALLRQRRGGVPARRGHRVRGGRQPQDGRLPDISVPKPGPRSVVGVHRRGPARRDHRLGHPAGSPGPGAAVPGRRVRAPRLVERRDELGEAGGRPDDRVPRREGAAAG